MNPAAELTVIHKQLLASMRKPLSGNQLLE